MARKDFHHPFQPYDIQQEFMQKVYDCIEDGKVGILESPTGTGKSLSLICGSLTWLREHKRKTFDAAVAAIQIDDDDPDWMLEHAKEIKRTEARQMRADLEARLVAIRQSEQKTRERHNNGEPLYKRRKVADETNTTSDSGEEQFVLDEYYSDHEDQDKQGEASTYSSETTKLMEKLGMIQPAHNERVIEEDADELKIFFCSRTHSQLSQFVGELKRVHLPSVLPPDPVGNEASEPLKHLTLGSRKNLCIHPKVSTLASQTAINERCMELQQPKTAADAKCPYLPNKSNEDLVLDFRDHALASIRDIEDLANVGKRLQICPYYASRPAIAPAEMVTLPYPLLLQKSARAALGISLKGHVVIIDEAHNLINAVEGICSAQITDKQLTQARDGLMVYLQKFRNHLRGSNRVYVTQVVRILDSLLLAATTCGNNSESGGLINLGDLLSGKGADQINLAKLVRYIDESRLARKVEGYQIHVKKNDQTTGKATIGDTHTADVPTLTHMQNFLMTLMNPSKEGQFFWSKEEDVMILRYHLLDPAEHFRDVVEDARAVILAGGTLSPMEDYRRQLFPYLESIETLSCGHLIPPSSLIVRTITADGHGDLEFSFKTRSDATSATRIGNVLRRLAVIVSGGLVVFFPSYSFLENVTERWKQDSFLDLLKQIKPVYRDGRNGSADAIFRDYSESVKSDRRGAILLSVLGGKLSEGINFSDDLGRCVVVTGLPFPNLKTPEWKAKLQYIEDKAAVHGEPKGKASREHAENVCMRSVNQAIGRVIRHKDDWASILLMDVRYGQERIRAKLPAWIRASMVEKESAGASALDAVLSDTAGFFARKKG